MRSVPPTSRENDTGPPGSRLHVDGRLSERVQGRLRLAATDDRDLDLTVSDAPRRFGQRGDGLMAARARHARRRARRTDPITDQLGQVRVRPRDDLDHRDQIGGRQEPVRSTGICRRKRDGLTDELQRLPRLIECSTAVVAQLTHADDHDTRRHGRQPRLTLHSTTAAASR
jgi:hypothetical protein